MEKLKSRQRLIEKLTIIIFFLSVFLFSLNMFFNYSANINFLFFWIPIVSIILILIYQIFFLDKSTFILFEIIILFFLLHLTIQVRTFGLVGSDSYIDYKFLKELTNNNHFFLGEDIISGWPALHIFSTALCKTTNIDIMTIAKFLPSFISAIIAIPLYLFVSNIYKNEKIGLLSCLMFGTVPQFVNFHSLFVRETFSFYFFVLFIFLLYYFFKKKSYSLKILILFLIPILIMSHHFTSFMMLLFFTNAIILYSFFEKSSKTKRVSEIRNFYLILLSGLVLYWLYITPSIYSDFSLIFNELFNNSEVISYADRIDLSSPIVTLRGNIIYYGFFIINGVISLILIMKLIFKRDKHIFEETVFTSFFFFCFFLGFLSLFFIGSLIFPDRFIPFALIYGLIPFVSSIFFSKRKIIKRVIIFLSIIFILLNLYNINPDYYTGVDISGRGIATEKEYAIANTIDVPEKYYAYIGASSAIYDIQNIEFRNYFVRDAINSEDFFRNANFAIIPEKRYLDILNQTSKKSSTYYNRMTSILLFEDFLDINKIADLDDIFILKWHN